MFHICVCVCEWGPRQGTMTKYRSLQGAECNKLDVPTTVLCVTLHDKGPPERSSEIDGGAGAIEAILQVDALLERSFFLGARKFPRLLFNVRRLNSGSPFGAA